MKILSTDNISNLTRILHVLVEQIASLPQSGRQPYISHLFLELRRHRHITMLYPHSIYPMKLYLSFSRNSTWLMFFDSLVDVNRRFHGLTFDSLCIRDLDMTIITNINSLYDQISSIDIEVLSRICEKILPRIHHQVHKLTVEQYSMKQILVANYPQLYSFSLRKSSMNNYFCFLSNCR